VDTVTVTMLGSSGSGKTSYLVGLFGTLTLGVDGYRLIAGGDAATSHRTVLDLLSRWDRLVAEGELPPPTDDDPKSYPMRFCRGSEPVLDIDWIDFRGGAISTAPGVDEEDSDVTSLLERLETTDCIFVTIDAQHLVDRQVERQQTMVMARTSMLYLGARIGTELVRRKAAGVPPPTMVVLVTKADLLLSPESGQATDDWRRRTEDLLVDDIRTILPVVFDPGITTVICPVTLGPFGGASRSSVSPGAVSPRSLHQPLLFAILANRWRDVDTHSASAATSRERADAARERKESLLSEGRRITARTKDLRIWLHDRSTRQASGRQAISQEAADRLHEQIKDLAMFRGGQRVQ
jgi:hypothetical protein